ncbi:hypothetical protein I3271_07575 [Photobacterium leiognathi]|uniref:hypothetical protein n=1 Tax=Photobacterium leiognathi TaxID=553611 RepID=UPI001EE0333D|nr:hypothetical protein [Photobacterium leiognathi]MCG3884546.1 hypothetical protein [Photobacterium leiognathi]
MNSLELQEATIFERRLVRMWKYGYLPSKICKVLDISGSLFSNELDRLDDAGFDLTKAGSNIPFATVDNPDVRKMIFDDARFYKSTLNRRYIPEQDVPYLVMCANEEISKIMEEFSVTNDEQQPEQREERNTLIIQDYLDMKGKRGVISVLSKKYGLSRKMIDNILNSANVKEPIIKAEKAKKPAKDQAETKATKTTIEIELAEPDEQPTATMLADSGEATTIPMDATKDDVESVDTDNNTVETPAAIEDNQPDTTNIEAVEAGGSHGDQELNVEESAPQVNEIPEIIIPEGTYELVVDIQAYLFKNNSIINKLFCCGDVYYKVVELDIDIAIVENIATGEEIIFEADAEHQYDITNAVKHRMGEEFNIGTRTYLVREVSDRVAVVQDQATKEPFFIKKDSNASSLIDFDFMQEPALDEDEVEITLSQAKQSQLINLYIQGEQAGADNLTSVLAKEFRVSEEEVKAIVSQTMY